MSAVRRVADRSAGYRARLRLPLDARPARPGARCKYHPCCSQYAIDALREARARARLGSPAGGCCAATPGPTAGSTTRDDQRLFADRSSAIASILSRSRTPLAWLLERFHDTLGLPWAWAIVAITILRPHLLVPLTVKQIHSMQSLQAHAPEMKEIQQKYKGDRQQAERGDDEVLQGEQHQPGRLVPAAPRPDPGLLRALLRPPGLREEILPTRRRPRLARHRPDIAEPANDALVGLRCCSSIYVVSQVPRRASCRRRCTKAQRVHHDRAAARSSSPFVAQLPGRPRPLLGDDEPLDGRPGPRHAPADPEDAAAAAEALVADAAEGAARRRPRQRRARRAAEAEAEAAEPQPRSRAA